MRAKHLASSIGELTRSLEGASAKTKLFEFVRISQ